MYQIGDLTFKKLSKRLAFGVKSPAYTFKITLVSTVSFAI